MYLHVLGLYLDVLIRNTLSESHLSAANKATESSIKMSAIDWPEAYSVVCL